MKPVSLALALTFLLVSTVHADECKMRSASRLDGDHIVGPIHNLYKDNSILGRCSVRFDITVDGQPHTLEHTYSGIDQAPILCRLAIEHARDNLLLELGGKFNTEAVTICKEGTATLQKIKIGDHILESEVGKSKVTKYFVYNNQNCRMFTERTKNRTYNGVICQNEDSETNWTVVDKW